MQQNHSGHSEVTRPLLDSRNLANECFILFIAEFEAAVSNDLKHFCTILSSEVWFDL